MIKKYLMVSFFVAMMSAYMWVIAISSAHGTCTNYAGNNFRCLTSDGEPSGPNRSTRENVDPPYAKFIKNDSGVWVDLSTEGTGDVIGPPGATDKAVVRFDGETGKHIQNSAVTISDTYGDITAGKYNTVAISGSASPELVVVGSASVHGTNTGNQVGDGVTVLGAGTVLDPFVAVTSAGSTNQVLMDVKEENTSAIYKGQVCYISGSSGTKIQVGKAQCDVSPKFRVVGLAQTDISRNNNGAVVSKGVLTGVDTRATNTYVNPNGETWTAGDFLFLATSAGGLTNVRPVSGRTDKIGYTVKGNSASDELIINIELNPVWLTAAEGEDIVLRTGDTGGGDKVSIRDHDNSEVASISDAGTVAARSLYITNPASTDGTRAGFNLGTGSGWRIYFETRQGEGWFQITDGDGEVMHRWDTKDYLLSANARLGFSDETTYTTPGMGAMDSAIMRTDANGLEVNNGTRGVYQDLKVKALTASGAISASNFPEAVSDLSDTVISSPINGDVMMFNGTHWVNAVLTLPTAAGAAVTYYLEDFDSDITGYEILDKTPGTTVEVEESVVVNAGQALIDPYATDSTGLGITSIDAGLWEFATFADVSQDTGVSEILIDVYSRTSGGTETLLFETTTGEITGVDPITYTTTTVQPAFSIASTDRLVVKYVGKTTAVVNTTVSFYHGGTEHYSHVHTPLTPKHNDLAGLQGGNSSERYHLTAAQTTVVGNTSGTNSGDNAANSTYASDYRAANFIAGTNYVSPSGSVATLTTPRAIQGVNFDGSAAINPINGTGFVKATGTTLSYDSSSYLTTAATAASSTAVTVTSDNSATTYYPYFGAAAGTTKSVLVDDTTTPMSYVPSTGTLTASNFSGIHSAGSIASGVTATTQSQANNSTAVATTAYVDTLGGTKQATLVSATNIKTVNSNTLLGSGDLSVSGIGTVVRTTGDYTNATTTPSNITGLSWSIGASTNQSFRCMLTTLNSNAGSALRFNINGPASPTRVDVKFRVQTISATAEVLTNATAFSAAAQSTSVTASVLTSASLNIIEGNIQNGTNAGTVQIMGTGSAAQSSTVYTGAFCEVF